MRYGAHQKQETLERVLHEAACAFRAHGPDQVSVQEIMRRAGLTHGGFYAYFTSKDDLLRQAIGRMFDEALQRWHAATGDASPTQGLLDYIDFYLSIRHVGSLPNGCPIPALGSDQARFPAQVRSAFAAGVRRLQQAISAHLAQMGYVDPAALGVSVLNELAGAVVLARCAPDRRQTLDRLKTSRLQLMARLGLANTA